MNVLCFVLVAMAAPVADPMAGSGDAHESNPVFQELIGKGVALNARVMQKLPAPLMPDGLSAEQQRKTLRALCVNRDPKKSLPHDALFERNSAVPYFFEDRELKPADPAATAYATDIWFVTWGDLAKLSKKDPLQLFSGNTSEAVPTTLDDDELAKRRITLDLRPPLRERYVNTVAELLDTVRVSSTNYTVVSESPESMVAASRVDTRFDDDPDYPNRWEMLPDGLKANPKAPRGPQRLSGAALYLKITRLAEPNGALFVEIHQVSTEPKPWFNGGQALRGKVPVWVNRQVRDFMILSLKTAPKGG